MLRATAAGSPSVTESYPAVAVIAGGTLSTTAVFAGGVV
jgi:hypothetical protein